MPSEPPSPREKRTNEREKQRNVRFTYWVSFTQYNPLQKVVKLWTFIWNVYMFLSSLSNWISSGDPFILSIARICCILVSNVISMSTFKKHFSYCIYKHKHLCYMQSHRHKKGSLAALWCIFMLGEPQCCLNINTRSPPHALIHTQLKLQAENLKYALVCRPAPSWQSG